MVKTEDVDQPFSGGPRRRDDQRKPVEDPDHKLRQAARELFRLAPRYCVRLRKKVITPCGESGTSFGVTQTLQRRPIGTPSPATWTLKRPNAAFARGSRMRSLR